MGEKFNPVPDSEAVPPGEKADNYKSMQTFEGEKEVADSEKKDVIFPFGDGLADGVSGVGDGRADEATEKVK